MFGINSLKSCLLVYIFVFVLEIEVVNLMRFLRFIIIGINEEFGICFRLVLSKFVIVEVFWEVRNGVNW